MIILRPGVANRMGFNYLLIVLITSQTNTHLSCGLPTVKCGKMTKFLSKWTKNQNSQFRILNLRAFQALSGLGSTAVEFVIQF